jgi:1,4-dihydroxy-2-naphthoyl-CoA hydrolase
MMSPVEPTEFLRTSMPLCDLLGIEAHELSPDRVVLSLTWRPELCTSGGLLHGGAVMTLADTAGAACAFVNLPDGAAGTSTIESKTNFMRGVRENGTVTATASPLHAGRSTIVVETELRDAGGDLVAKTTQTQAVLNGS